MGFRINTNIAAMASHSSALANNRNLDNSLNKLSSGLRINKAADDASGLAIANALRSQASSLGQAVSNGNDAIGLIQTADGALAEYSNILDTIKTKAVQAASDGQNSTTRLAIQKDIDKLMEELNTIAKTTSFNGQKLLSGTFTNKEFQMGASANESVKVSVASAETNQIGQTSRATLSAGSEQGGEIQLTLKSALTGENVTLKSVDIQYNNDAQNGMGALADEINRYSADTGISAKAVVSSSSSAAVSAGVTGSDFAINGVNIGAINVAENDNDGTLLSAINSKTIQTGVSATLSSDGKMTLASSDGRAIKVEGDTSVMGATAKEMSTVGHIELVQNGSSAFQIEGIGAGAVGANITLAAGSGYTTVKDSVLAAGSTIDSSSTIKAGTVIGGDLTSTGAVTTVLDTIVKAGSTIISGSTIEQGSKIGGSIVNVGAAALAQDAFITAGSTLKLGTVFDSGTVIQQDFTDGTTTFHKGDVLTTDFTTTADLTLTADMTMKYDASAAAASIALGSTINTGSVVGSDIATTGNMLISEDSTLKAGTILLSATILKAGSTLGGDTVNNVDFTTSTATELKAGSVLSSGTIMAKGSTIGGSFTVSANTNLTEDMMITAGSTLGTGTILKAGTIMVQDTTAGQTGVAMKAGDVLTSDVTTNAAITLAEDMKLLKGTGATAGRIGAASILNINTTNSGSVGLSDEEFTNLSDIDVTTLEGAMKAIDTVAAAISNLDTIRSDLGSVQNQVVSTINNISVTQVNVKAAESNIRDVDFAAESANFSKFNILAQSGSYAMSQANAVQQNVMRLLQ